MKKYKVIFDTNFIWNSGADVVSGNKDELSKFEKICEIIIPDMVIRELREQRREALISHEGKLKSNFFYKKFKSDPSISLPSIDIEQELLKIEQNYRGNYKIISLSTQENAFFEMQELALQKLPPFKKGTDAGFKDAYIYFTILEYAVSQVGETIFVVTDDSTLKLALEKHNFIKVVKSYDEFTSYIIEGYRDDDYLIRTIRNYLNDESMTEQNLIGVWENIDDENILLLESKGQKHVLLISAREIRNHALFSEVQDAKNALINSINFEATHYAIARLENYVKYLSDDDIKKILDACYENEQISRIATNPDVKQFILDLSAHKQHLLDDWTKSFIERL